MKLNICIYFEPTISSLDKNIETFLFTCTGKYVRNGSSNLGVIEKAHKTSVFIQKRMNKYNIVCFQIWNTVE